MSSYSDRKKIKRAIAKSTIYQDATKNARKISKEVRFKVFQKYNSCCSVCGISAGEISDYGKTAVLHLDHIIPVTRGGTNDENNLQVLCEDCNLGKLDSLI